MRFRKRHAVTAAALLAGFGAVAVVWNHTPLVPDHVARLLTDDLLRQHGYRAQLDAVRGTWSGDVLFLHPRIVALEDSSRVLLRADALRVGLRRPWALFHGGVTIDRLRLDRPRLELPPGPTQNAPGNRPPEQPRFPGLAIGELEVTDAEIAEREGTSRRVLADHVDGKVRLRSRPRELRATLEQARGFVPEDSLRVEDLRADFVLHADTVDAQDVQLRTSGSRLQGSGSFDLATRRGSWRGTVGSLDLDEVRRILHRPIPPGTLSGTIDLAASGRAFEGRGSLRGTVGDLRFEDVQYDAFVSPLRSELRRLAGRVNDTRVEASLAQTARSLSGSVRLVAADLRRLVPGRYAPPALARLPDHEITGSITFVRSADGPLSAEIALDRSRIGEVQLDRGAAKLALDASGARLEKVRFEGPLGRVQGSGSYRGGDIDAEFEAELRQVGAVLALAGRAPEPEGAARVSGRVTGRMPSPQVEAEVQFEQLAARGAELWSGSLGMWGRPLGPDATVDLELRADSLRVRGRTLREIGADMEYRDRVLHVVRSQGSAGDTLVGVALAVRTLPYDWYGRPVPSTRVDLETALVRLSHTEIRIEDPAVIWLRDGGVHVDSLQVVTRAGSLRLAGTYEAKTEALAFRADLEGVDLGFVPQLVALPIQLSGTGTGWLQASGTLSRTRLDARLDLRSASFNGLPVDSLTVAIVGSENATDVRQLRLATPYGNLHGGLRIGEVPSVRRLLDPRRPAPSLAALEHAPISGVLQLESMQLGRLWQARKPGLPPSPWSAELTAFVAVGGTFAVPTVEVRGRAERIAAAQVRVTGAQFDLDYENEGLELRGLGVRSEGQNLHAEGRLPLRVHLLRGVTVLRDQPLKLDIVLPRSSFAIVDRFVPLFLPPPEGMPRGDVEGEVRVTGTAQSPQMHGNFAVHGASFLLRDMEELYREVDATGEFDGKVVHLRDMRGLSGSKGTIRQAGDCTVEFAGFKLGAYHFRNLQLQEVPIYSIPDMTAIVSGSLNIDSKLVAGHLVPNLSGTLEVLRGEMRQEFEEASNATLETDVPLLLTDLTLRAEKGNVWIRNSVVDAELAGTIELKQQERENQILGQVRVKRGKYSYLVQWFEITRGELDFSRNTGFNPGLDIEAERGRPGQRVYVTLTGSAARPQLNFRSDRIDATSDQIQQGILELTGEGSAATAVANIAEQAVRNLQIVNDITIDPTETESSTPGSTAQYGYNLSTRQPVSRDVYFVYTQGVRSDIEQRVAVEYDVNRWLLLEAAYERRNLSEAGPSQSQNAYFVNFKYRHEY